jgi:hypothetical protein
MSPPKIKRAVFLFPRRERGESLAGAAFRGLFLLMLLVFAFALAVLAMGIPASWIRLIEGRLPETPFVVEADTVSYDIFRGVRLRQARIYAKGDTGLPWIAADTVRLGIQPAALLTGGDWLREVSIEGGTVRWLRRETDRGEGVPDFGNWNFRLEVADSRFFGQRVGRGRAEVAVRGSQVKLARLEGEIGDEGGPGASLKGRLEVDAATRHFASALTWNGDPLAVESFLTEIDKPGAVAYFRLFKPGERPPSGDVEFEGDFGEKWSFSMALSGAARNCRYREVDIPQLFLNMQFQAGEGRRPLLSFDPLVLIRKEGLVAGGFSVDFTTGDIRYDGYSTCHPATLVRLIAPGVAESADAMRLEGPIRIHAGGTANRRDMTRNAMTFFLESQKIGFGRFAADRLAFTARLTGTSLEIRELAGECYGGSFTGAMDLVASWTPDQEFDKMQFSAQGEVQGLDGRGLAVAAGARDSDRYEGRLTGAGRVSGILGSESLDTWSGQGSVKVSQARLFRFPLFGPLSDFLARLIPGLDPQAGLTDAVAVWRVEEGRIKSDSITVGGDRVSLNAKGSYALTNSLNFDIQIKLMNTETLLGKAVRLVTLPMSKLFEFRLKGRTDNPRWYPVNFSSELFDRLSGGGRQEPAPAGKKDDRKGGSEP